MTNITTIEDLLHDILGLVLGGAPGAYSLAAPGSGSGQGKSAINDGFRPASVKGAGPPWLIAQRDTLTFTGNSWKPEYDKDAVTFYKWTNRKGLLATKDITRVTVWVGLVNNIKDGTNNTQGQTANSADPNKVVNPTANPVITLGNAWELIHKEINNVAGAGTSFDPDSIRAVRQVFTSLIHQLTGISGWLRDDITQVNVKGPEFRGSAEQAWYQRVTVADSYLNDLYEQWKNWDVALEGVEDAARGFVTALKTANENWFNREPRGVWQHPFRLVAAVLNGGRIDTINSSIPNLLDSPISYQHFDNGMTYAETNGEDKPVYFIPPRWLKHGSSGFDAFDIGAWNQFDTFLRTAWANHVIATFGPVLTAAKTLITAFVDARNALVLEAPAPVAPPPMPNGDDLANGLANGPNDPFANWTDPFANWTDPFANWTDPFANMGDPFANMGGTFPNGDPLPNDSTFTASSNPFADMNSALVDPSGDGGVGAGAAFGLGGAGPLALTPTSSTKNTFADPSGGPQSLGELTPDQLHQLAAGGQLDDVPLTPEQTAFLQQNGLGGAGTLGGLDTEQLDALHNAGLLDGTPISSGQLADLGLSDAGGFGASMLDQTSTVDTDEFPTTLDGFDVSAGSGLDGLQLGDVTRPGATDHPDIPGFLTGTGGLSMPGLSGSAGALSPGGLGLGFGSDGVIATSGGGVGTGGLGSGGLGSSGLGSGVGSSGLGEAQATGVGAPGSGAGSGAGGSGGIGGAGAGSGMPMMPFMPPMMGGMGGGGAGQGRDRQRNTWLREDERVWGTDPDCAPAVVGRRGRSTRSEDDDYTTHTDDRPIVHEEQRPYRAR